MPRGKKFTAEQIIGKLREAEVGLAQGKTVPEVVRKLGVTATVLAGRSSQPALPRPRRLALAGLLTGPRLPRRHGSLVGP